MARRQVSEEAKAAMMAARKETLAENRERRGKRLTVNGYSVYRGDENNVFLQKGTDDPLYYPDVTSALVGLYRRMIEPAHKTELKGHLAAISSAEARIVEAIAGVRDLFDAA